MNHSFEFVQMPAAMRHHLLQSMIDADASDADDASEPEMQPESEAQSMRRFPHHTPIAMAYVPMQQWEEPYPAEQGLQVGTLFSALNDPFLGGDCPDA